MATRASQDRKSTRLNSSHTVISYAVFCLKKKSPARIVVGFSKGGATDIKARLMGQWLTDRTGQQFIVDNKHGASGNIGTEAFFFVNDTATTEIYTLSLHDALPIWSESRRATRSSARQAPRTRSVRGSCCSRRSEEHTSELQSHSDLVCRLLLE